MQVVPSPVLLWSATSNVSVERVLRDILTDIEGKLMRAVVEMAPEDRGQFARILKSKWRDIQNEYIRFISECNMRGVSAQRNEVGNSFSNCAATVSSAEERPTPMEVVQTTPKYVSTDQKTVSRDKIDKKRISRRALRKAINFTLGKNGIYRKEMINFVEFLVSLLPDTRNVTKAQRVAIHRCTLRYINYIDLISTGQTKRKRNRFFQKSICITMNDEDCKVKTLKACSSQSVAKASEVDTASPKPTSSPKPDEANNM